MIDCSRNLIISFITFLQQATKHCQKKIEKDLHYLIILQMHSMLMNTNKTTNFYLDILEIVV